MHKKITANLIIALLLTGLFVAIIAVNVSVSQQASAQTLFPVPNVSVSASGNGNGLAVTNAQGQYSINNYLGTGDYTLTTLAEGYVTTEVDNVPVTAGSTTPNINIIITVSGIITGQVTDASTGAPLANVIVVAENSTGQDSSGYSAFTDSNGNYRIDTNLPTGTYNITADSLEEPYVSQTVTQVSVTAGATTSNINFALPVSATISGTVTDSVSGSPLSGVLVEAISSNDLYSAIATTTSSGQYTLNTDLGTGTYTVQIIEANNHLPTSISGIAVTQGQTTPGVNLALKPSGTISGTITQPDGTPIAGADVSAFDSTFTFFGSATTNAAGQYQITTNLGTGTYTVEASYETSINTAAGVSVTQGQPTSNVNIQLTITPSGTITGKVTDSNGNPIDGASVSAENTATFTSNSATTDSSGDYTISTGLPTGTYTVTAQADEYTQQVLTSIAVTINQVTSAVNFQLTAIPSGTISGIVQTEQLAVTPTPTPTPTPTATPTPIPTATPTPIPTAIPTAVPVTTPIPTVQPVVTPKPTTAPTPTPTPAPTTVQAKTSGGSTVNLKIAGSIASSQMSSITIATDKATSSTTISFTVTGASGTTGFGNITIPKSAVTYGTTPTVTIDGHTASNQGYTQDTNNYYVWYTTTFSTHQISIAFTTTASPTPTPTKTSSAPQGYIYAIVVVVVIIVIVAALLVLRRRNMSQTSKS